MIVATKKCIYVKNQELKDDKCFLNVNRTFYYDVHSKPTSEEPDLTKTNETFLREFKNQVQGIEI